MEKHYNEIIELDKLNVNGSFSTHLAKLTEEIGEFASEANKLSGLKRNKHNESIPEITENLAAEAADCIQNIMAICGRAGVTYKQLSDALGESNIAWAQGYLNKE